MKSEDTDKCPSSNEADSSEHSGTVAEYKFPMPFLVILFTTFVFVTARGRRRICNHS